MPTTFQSIRDHEGLPPLEGPELKRRREALGLTQQQLATQHNVTANTIARWERGEMAIEHPSWLEITLRQLEAEAATHAALRAQEALQAEARATGASLAHSGHSIGRDRMVDLLHRKGVDEIQRAVAPGSGFFGLGLKEGIDLIDWVKTGSDGMVMFWRTAADGSQDVGTAILCVNAPEASRAEYEAQIGAEDDVLVLMMPHGWPEVLQRS